MRRYNHDLATQLNMGHNKEDMSLLPGTPLTQIKTLWSLKNIRRLIYSRLHEKKHLSNHGGNFKIERARNAMRDAHLKSRTRLLPALYDTSCNY